LASNGAREMSNVIVAASHICMGQSKRCMALSGYVSEQAAGQGDMDGMAALDAAKTLLWDGLGVHSLLHHPMAKENLVTKIKVSLHEKEGMELINVDDSSLFLKDHLEARLPVEGEKPLAKHNCMKIAWISDKVGHVAAAL